MGKEKGLGVLIGAIVAGAIGVGTAVNGIINKKQAKRINDNAAKIKNEAIERYNVSYNSTCGTLDKLGQLRLEVINSFNRFSDNMEKLQGRPEFKNNYAKDYKMSSITIKDFKVLSSNIQDAISTAGGAAVGTLAGLAAFGTAAVIVAPTLLGGGFVLCIRGHSLKKKAIANEAEAIQLNNDINQVTNFYNELTKTTNYFLIKINYVYQKYFEYLEAFEQILRVNKYWDCFSDFQKKQTENLVMLAKILYDMCKVELVIKDTANETEIINYKGINSIVREIETKVQYI